MTDIQERITLWQRQNPLRVWRESKNLSMRACAPIIGTSMNSIQDWEQGQYRPRVTSFTRIAAAMGSDLHDLIDAWDAWWSQRPSP